MRSRRAARLTQTPHMGRPTPAPPPTNRDERPTHPTTRPPPQRQIIAPIAPSTETGVDRSIHVDLMLWGLIWSSRTHPQKRLQATTGATARIARRRFGRWVRANRARREVPAFASIPVPSGLHHRLDRSKAPLELACSAAARAADTPFSAGSTERKRRSPSPSPIIIITSHGCIISSLARSIDRPRLLHPARVLRTLRCW